jgi:N-carbamoyl-L-amino-acid hydrolase
VTDIDGERLLTDLRTLSRIGGQADGGVDRLAWSEADLAARRWFAERIREAGLEPRVDAALNVFGHLPGSSGPRLLTGSHLDSVPNGGRLDGAYGAVAGLEVLRTMVESGDPLTARVEVVAFADEEGVRFGTGLIGSLALIGELDLNRLRDERDWQGVPIRQVIATAGREVDRMLDAQQHLPSIAAFVELHIEQGPRMEADGVDLAVVTGIVGVYREQVRVVGSQNHAGTTPFRLRHDAGRAAARAAAGLRELVQGIDPEAVANIGRSAPRKAAALRPSGSPGCNPRGWTASRLSCSRRRARRSVVSPSASGVARVTMPPSSRARCRPACSSSPVSAA